MPLRFRRTLRLVPGLRLNLAKRGASLSLGERGTSLNFGRRRSLTLGLPGTGISYRHNLGRRRRQGRLGALLWGIATMAVILWIAFHALRAAF